MFYREKSWMMILFVCASKDSEYCIMLTLVVCTLLLSHFDELLDNFEFYLGGLVFD